MDKVFSTRIDEGVAFEIENLARRLKIPKKQVIENAVRNYARETGGLRSEDIVERSWGCWKRSESPDKTLEKARDAFASSMKGIILR